MLQKQGDEKVLHQYAQLTNHAGYLKAKGIELEKELEQAKNVWCYVPFGITKHRFINLQ